MKGRDFITRRAWLAALAPLVGAQSGGRAESRLPEVPPGPLVKAEAAPGALAKLRWRLQYQFDQPILNRDEAPLEVSLGGIRFASPQYGIAWLTAFQRAGGLGETGSGDGYLIVTRDGGKTWTPQRTKGNPLHVHLLDEAHVWLLTTSGIYFSAEFGADWRKLKRPSSNLTRLHFLSPRRGFAFGLGKTFWRTDNGGGAWTKVPEAEALNIKSPVTWWAAMSFIDAQTGVIAGVSRPPRSVMPSTYLDQLPSWMTPERAVTRRDLPGSLFTLNTTDGGASWKPSMVSAFGTVRELRYTRSGGVVLFAYSDAFTWPTEVIRLDTGTGASSSLFRRKQYTITDIALLEGGGYVLAGIEFPGRLRSSGVSGKVKIFWSGDGKQWVDMKVHYAAEGTAAYLSRAGGDALWAASNQGHILKLAE